MGLGLLFFGYLFCLNLFNVFFLPFAAGIMFFALKKLSFINTSLSRAKFFLLPLFALGLLGIVPAITQAAGVSIKGYDQMLSILSCLAHIAMPAFLLVLFRGLRELSDEVKLPKLSAKAVRNQLFCLFYYVPALLLELPLWETNLFLQTAALFTLLLGLVVFFLNAKTLYGYYRFVCMPGDEN